MSARAAVEKLIAEIGEAQPDLDDFEKWRAQRAKHLAEVAALRGEVERQQNTRRDHQAAVESLRAEKEKLRAEVAGLQNDRNRLHRQCDELATWLKIAKFQHRVE